MPTNEVAVEAGQKLVVFDKRYENTAAAGVTRPHPLGDPSTPPMKS